MIHRLVGRIPLEHAGNVSWTMGAQIVSLPLRLLRFMALARLLGVEQYGLFIAATAFVGFAAPFAGLGYGFLLLRQVSRSRQSFGYWWGASILALILTGVPLTAILIIFGGDFIGGSTIVLLFAVTCSELFFGRFIDFAERSYRAHRNMRRAAFISLLPELGRTMTLIPFLAMRTRTAEGWALWQLGGLALAGSIAVAVTSCQLGRPDLRFRPSMREIKDGMHFSLGQSAGSIYTTIDRVMLARLSSLDAAGIYSAASVIIGMALIPISSLSRAMMTRYFELGAIGVHKTVDFACRNTLAGLAYSVPTSITLLLTAPVVPMLIGDDYVVSVNAIRGLAILPTLYVFTDVGAATINAIDRPQDRTLIFFTVAVLTILLNMWLIPRYGWQGAVFARLCSEAVLGGTLWVVILFWRRAEALHGR